MPDYCYDIIELTDSRAIENSLQNTGRGNIATTVFKSDGYGF